MFGNAQLFPSLEPLVLSYFWKSIFAYTYQKSSIVDTKLCEARWIKLMQRDGEASSLLSAGDYTNQ